MAFIDIPFISGFQEVAFKAGAVPTKSMWLELIRPGTDPNSSRLVPVDANQAIESRDFGSQLLLQKYSNRLVPQLCGDDSLKPVCDALGLNFDEACYHFAVVSYIDHFFAPMPNLVASKDAALQLFSMAYSLYSGNAVEAFARWTRSIQLQKATGFDPGTVQEILEQSLPESLPVKKLDQSVESPERVEQLRGKFPDYQKSQDFISEFYSQAVTNKVIGNRLVGELQAGMVACFQERQRGYRQASRTPAKTSKRLQQCPHCSFWYETSLGGNGKLRSHCGQRSCRQEWDRLRRRKERL